MQCFLVQYLRSFFLVISGIILLFMQQATASVGCASALSVVSQNIVMEKISSSKVSPSDYIKNKPVLFYQIPASGKVPKAISSNLGLLDKIPYTKEFLAEHLVAGAYIALQVDKEQFDFYPMSEETFNDRYKPESLSQLEKLNNAVIESLNSLGFETSLPNLAAGIKTDSVKMYRMSEVGFDFEMEVIIEGPYGEQTKEAGADAFLAWHPKHEQYYMIQEEAGSENPISYILLVDEE